ncbi:DDE_3 domain-containing protein [Trichonephila clavipes]|nr:DDE_3 domain-containing protein [Trichonephila clavipes]
MAKHNRGWKGNLSEREKQFSAGPIITLKGRITGEKYREILADHVHPRMQTLFPAGDGIFQDDNAPIHAMGFCLIMV